MNKLTALFVFLALLGGVFLLYLSKTWPFDGRPEPVDVALQDVKAEMHGVRVSGTAHFPIKVVQHRQSTLFQPETTWYLYPLFPKQDTMGRSISVIVASQAEPDEMLAFEDLTVEGLARPPRAVMGPDVEKAFIDAGYTFAEQYVAIEAYPPEPAPAP